MADTELTNIDIDPPQVYQQYSVQQTIDTTEINIGGGVAPVTTINTNTGSVTGPVITVTGGVSGFSFNGATSTITLVSPLTTKGDLYTYSTLGIRLAVGANGRILTANSATATGLEWATSATAAALAVTTIAFADSPYSLTDSNDVVLVNAVGGAVTINLHAIATAKQKPYYIKKIDASANAVTVDANGGETIDGAATQATVVQYTSFTLIPNNAGTDWSIV